MWVFFGGGGALGFCGGVRELFDPERRGEGGL